MRRNPTYSTLATDKAEKYADSVLEDTSREIVADALATGELETDAGAAAVATAKSLRVPPGVRQEFVETFVRAAVARAHELAVAFDDEEQDDLENPDGSPAIADDDYVIVVTGRLGSQLAVNQTGHRLTLVDDKQEALAFIARHMERAQFWPNIWYENDHGNVDLLDATGKIIRSWV
jgi:hypothetical protein